MAVVKWPGLQQYDAEMKQYIATHYEPKLRFDSTPVYSVTLAEDASASDSQQYIIDLGGAYDGVYVHIKTPIWTQNEGMQVKFWLANGSKPYIVISTFLATTGRFIIVGAVPFYGLKQLIACGQTTDTSSTLVTNLNLAEGERINKVHMFNMSGSQIVPAGTQISVYTISEV